jgi:phosphate transport system substrate-binding protein
MNCRKFFRISFFLLAVLSGSVTAQDVIRINGSHTLGNGVVPILVQGWMKKFGYSQISVSPGNSGIATIAAKRDGETLQVEINGKGSRSGFQDLVDGNAEIAMMSRSLSAKEIDDGWQLGNLNSPDQEHVIALQAVTVIVHSKNTVAGLDISQLSKILSGEITDWKQLGGKRGAIHLHVARQGTG